MRLLIGGWKYTYETYIYSWGKKKKEQFSETKSVLKSLRIL